MRSPFKRPSGTLHPGLAIVVVFLALALLKPWSFGQDRAEGGRSGAPVATPSGTGLAAGAQPSPSAAPAILDPNAMPCLTDAAEQIVIIERWAGHEVRSWVASTDETESGPLDDRLVPIVVFSTHVVGIGVCAPRALAGAGRPAALLLDVRSIVRTADGPSAVDFGTPDPITVQLTGQEPALLFGVPATTPGLPSVGPVPSDRPAGSTATRHPTESPTAGPASGQGSAAPARGSTTWPTGSYAIAFRFPSDGQDVVRWLRIDLVQGAGEAG